MTPTILVISGLIALTIAIVAAAIAYEKRQNQQRQQAVQQQTDELGLDFSSEGDDVLEERVSGFQLFNKGRDRKILNVVRGQAEQVEIVIADYHFTTGGGESQQRHKRTVALLASPDLQVPEFTLRPETLFDKIGAVLGMQDIDFDSHPEFSMAFLLKGPDEAGIRKFFDDSILIMLQQHKTICIEAVPGKMIFYFADRRPGSDQLKELFAEALQIYGHFEDRAKDCH